MQILHRLVGYDRQTDRMRVWFEVPDRLLPDAKKMAQAPGDDPEAAWSYPLSDSQACGVAGLIGAEIEPKEAEFFLEAFADPVSGSAA